MRGFSQRQLRHPALTAPYSGVRSLASSGDSLYERALAYLPRFREGERFSHATALALQGCAGLPFTEVVVAIDALVLESDTRFDPTAATRLQDLHALLEASSGRRGVTRFRSALDLARVGAESRMETLTRLAGERVGVTGLKLQLVVVDRDGRGIGRFDLAEELSRVLFEYDGEQHRTSRAQYLRDLDRLERARDAGWRVLLFHAEEVLARPDHAGRRMLLATGRPPRPVPVRIRLLLEEWPSSRTVSALPRKTR